MPPVATSRWEKKAPFTASKASRRRKNRKKANNSPTSAKPFVGSTSCILSNTSFATVAETKLIPTSVQQKPNPELIGSAADLYEKAKKCYSARNAQAALESIERAITLSSPVPNYHYLMFKGKILQELEKYSASLECYDIILKKFSDVPFNVAMALDEMWPMLDQMGQHSQAINILEKLYKLTGEPEYLTDKFKIEQAISHKAFKNTPVVLARFS